MIAAGIDPPAEMHADGVMRRFGRGKHSWYRLHEFLSREGTRVVVGSFGNFIGADKFVYKVQVDWKQISVDERERMQRASAEAEARRVANDRSRARFAANRARQQWNSGRAVLREGERCPYLDRKGVEPDKGLRFLPDGTLLVPMVRYDVTEDQAADPAYTGPMPLVGLQKISPDGEKRFNKGMAKEGAACRIGSKPRNGDLLIIAEGAATALSIRMALDREHPVFVAFDAGNLAPVARILRALYPRSPMLFAADDDAYLEAQLNKRLRDDYGVQATYRVAMGETQLLGRGEKLIGIRAEAQRDPAGVEGITAAITVDEVTRPLSFVNTGRLKARAAADEVGNARVWRPVFERRELHADPDGPKLTDYNDLHASEGLGRVRDQLLAAISAILGERAEHREAPQGENAAPAAPAAAENAREAGAGGSGGSRGGGGRGGGADSDPPDWSLYRTLLDRFVLVYPSGEAYDRLLGRLVKIEHMRNLFGKRYVGMWINSDAKRVVLDENVVFDPTGAADPEKTVNLFHGLPLKPDAGKSCARVLELLQYLCGEEGRDISPVTDWVLRWLAYPLQHVGAKMRTAVVMYGDEGTGKNMLGAVMQEIYGDHGSVITQQQLNSQFNGWLSAKLFIAANEVVTRQEMTHHVGLLKHLVTEPDIFIERKGVDARRENNHANLMFFSNELQPLKISPGDRRYMVIRTPRPKPDEFYAKVGEEIRAGAAEGFFAHLMGLDLGDFNPFTKPLITEAKRDLIEIGMSAAELFWHDLHDGTIGLPYCPAQSDHVYRAYLRWCFLNGERMPARINRFIPDFMKLNGVSRRSVDIPPPERPAEVNLFLAGQDAVLKQRRVLVMGDAVADSDLERQRIAKGCADFYEKLREYTRGEQQGSPDGAPAPSDKAKPEPEAPL
jgi:putative DNA primase/helicase